MPASRRFTVPAAMLLGVALGLIGLRNTLAHPGEGGQAKAPTLVSASDSPPAGDGAFSGQRPETSVGAYTSAWNSLKDGHLPKNERIALQRAIVREWAMVDLPAAIRAVTADQSARFGSLGIDDPLRKALQPGIAAQPELAWHLIETHAFGLHTQWLREAWIQVEGRRNPLKVVKRSTNFSSYDRAVAMNLAVETASAAGKPQTDLDQVVEEVLSLPTAPLSLPPRKALIDELRSTVGYPGLLERIRNTQDPELRSVFLEAYLGITTGPIDLEGEPQWKAELKSLPPKIREEAAKILENNRDL